MINKQQRTDGRFRRKRRIRKKVTGSTSRPRLTVYRSNRHIYAQLVDDVTGHTLVCASSKEADLAGVIDGKGKKEQAQEVGKALAARAKEKGVAQIVFDRNGYIYHGRVAAVAAGAREGGLEF